MTEEGANSDTTAPGNKEDGREDAGGGGAATAPTTTPATAPAQDSTTPADPAILALLKYRYSKEELLSLREEPLSQRKPDFIDLNEISPTIWDPTRWNDSNAKKKPTQEASENGTGTGPPGGSAPSKSTDLDHRRRPGDPRERIRKENDGIVLSPQRRSFNSGCFVPVRETRPPRPHSPLGPKSENIIPVREIASSTSSSSRRIGSGRILRDNWDFSDKSDHHNNGDNDYNFRPQSQQNAQQQLQRNSQDNHHHVPEQRRSFGRGGDYENKEKPARNSRYNGPNRRMSSNVEQEEPEWFSSGPISQNDTIELRGFDESERLGNSVSNNNNNVNAKKKMSPSQAKRAREWFKKRSIKEEDDESNSVDQSGGGGGGGQVPGARSTPIPQDGGGGVAASQNGGNDNEKKKKPETGASDENSKANNEQQNYMFEDFLKADSIPGFAGLLTNGIGGDGDSNAGKSRFSKWFSSMETNHQSSDAVENRRSSIPQDDANIMNLLKDLNETSVSIPGDSESYFAPISPAAANAGGGAAPPHSKSVSIMEMLQRTKQNESSIKSQVPGKIMNLVELEAKMRHGGGGGAATAAEPQMHKHANAKSEEDMTAFNRLLAHMSGGQGGAHLAQKSQPMSLMEMLSHSQQQDEAQARMAAQLLGPSSPSSVPTAAAAAAAAAQNDIVTRLQHAKQQQQQLDMLTKLINSNMQIRASPLPSDMDVQQGRELLSRPEAQAILQALHQRIPSPRELQVHTQNILQRALIKKKLEEQQENFRKKQEMQQQRGQSPNNNNNITVSAAAAAAAAAGSGSVQQTASKSVSSPTPLAFTPTSVLRKMTAEKDDSAGGKEAKLLGQGRAVTGMRPSSSQQQQVVQQQQQPQQAIGQWPSYQMNMKQAGRPIVKANSFQQQQQQPDQFFTQQQQQKFLNQLQIQQQQQRKQQQQQQQQYHGGYSMNHHSQYNSGGGGGFSQQLTQQQLRAQHQQQARPANVPQQQQPASQLGFGSGGGGQQQQQGSTGAASWQQLLNRGHGGGRGGLNDGDLSPTSNQLTRWFSPDLLERARVGELPSTAGLSQHVPSLEEIERLTAPAVHN